MMYYIPFIIFFLYFYIAYKRNGLDLSACIIAVYCLSCGVAIYLHNLPKHVWAYDFTFDISIIPVLIFTTIICISISPFYMLNTNKRRPIKLITNLKYFNAVSWFFIILFFGLIIALWDDILQGVLQQNLVDVRQNMHEGNIENAFTRQKSVTGKLLGYGCATVASGSSCAIPFAFYSICFTKNKKLFSFLIFLSSFSSVILGILLVDRSSSILWIMHILVAYFLFKPYLNKQSQKQLRIMAIVIGTIIMIYLAAVTIARFTMLDGGASGGVLIYLGQPFPNFCNIWDHVEIKEYHWTKSIFPTINYFFMNTDMHERAVIIGNVENIHLNGFYSYLGTFYFDAGPIGACLYPLIISFITLLVCSRIKRKSVINFKDLMYIYLLAIIPLYGLINYYYKDYSQTMCLFFVLFILSKLKYTKEPYIASEF